MKYLKDYEYIAEFNFIDGIKDGLKNKAKKDTAKVTNAVISEAEKAIKDKYAPVFDKYVPLIEKYAPTVERYAKKAEKYAPTAKKYAKKVVDAVPTIRKYATKRNLKIGGALGLGLLGLNVATGVKSTIDLARGTKNLIFRKKKEQ